MFNIAICEDEEIHRNILKGFLEKIFSDIGEDYEIIEFDSGEKLIKNYNSDIDIIFLDILMRKLTGMEVAREIRKFDRKVEIIFTTSVMEYMKEGYEVRAYRYVLKPIDYEELKRHILSYIEEISKLTKNHIIIETKSEMYKILIDDITYIEVIKKDLIIHTLKKNYHTKMSLSKIEEELKKYNFFRCHKSYLVNLNQIENITQKTIILNSGEIPVSRYRIKELKIKLLELLGDVLC